MEIQILQGGLVRSFLTHNSRYPKTCDVFAVSPDTSTQMPQIWHDLRDSDVLMQPIVMLKSLYLRPTCIAVG